MGEKKIHAVTGAFGYSGKYIAQKLLERGEHVVTLTNSTQRENPFKNQVKTIPFNFDQPEKLAKSLEGVSILYNTYWVRFNHKMFSHSVAVKNTQILFEAAKKAGVEKIVHISITNPSMDSPLEYFKDKAILEESLIQSGIPYSILRPAVIFGKEDILVNNIAWFLRKLPVFGIPGDGQYGIQPIFVEDLAEIAIAEGTSTQNCCIEAIGPETFTYREFVETVGKIIGKKRKIVSMPPWIVYWTARITGLLTGDIIITKEEIKGLMAGNLAVEALPAGKTRLTDWCSSNIDTLGKQYTSELARRKDRTGSYASN